MEGACSTADAVESISRPIDSSSYLFRVSFLFRSIDSSSELEPELVVLPLQFPPGGWAPGVGAVPLRRRKDIMVPAFGVSEGSGSGLNSGIFLQLFLQGHLPGIQCLFLVRQRQP